MLIRRAAFKTVWIFLAGAAALPAQEWTEQSVIQAFLSQSPAVRESRARTEATRAEAAGRVLYPNPQVSFSHEGAGVNQFFEARQTLPLSGRRRFLQEAGAAAVAASESEGEARLWDLRSDARRAFYRLVAAQEYESSAASGMADLDDVIRGLRARETEGEGSRYDRLRAERERSEVGSQAATAHALVIQARGSLAAYLPPQSAVTQIRWSLAVSTMLAAETELAATALALRAEVRL